MYSVGFDFDAVKAAKPMNCVISILSSQGTGSKHQEPGERFIMPFIRKMVDTAQGAETDLRCQVVDSTIVCEFKEWPGMAILETDKLGRPQCVNWISRADGYAISGIHWLNYE
jgi:hypothetical protein